MKNLLVETDTDVAIEIEKWLNIHKYEFDNDYKKCTHICLMFDDDSNMYEVTVAIKKVMGNDITTEN